MFKVPESEGLLDILKHNFLIINMRKFKCIEISDFPTPHAQWGERSD